MMITNYLRLALRLYLFVFSLIAFAQTPPTITANVTATSAICSGTGSITINTATSAAPYNLVNSDLSALPAGATVGGQNHTPTFTSGNPHYVQLTPASNDKRGFITFAETALKPVDFIATFGLYVGNGTGADGTSFNYGKINTSNNGYGEAGMIDSGLAIGFNDYANKIKIYYNNVELTSFNVQGTLNNSGWKPVAIELTASGQLTLSYGGYVYCLNYQLPAAYVTDSKTNWQYGFAARCGGLNNLHAINDVVIKDRTSWEYSLDGTNFTTNNNFTNLNPGTYNTYARIGNAAYNANGYNSTASFGTKTITSLSVNATLTRTNPTTCTATGTIAISNVTHNMASYDLVNVSLTNNQLGNATIGNLGTCCNPFFGAGDLVLTPNTSNRAGYIAFNSTVATPNAFTANYDVFVGGGNGGDGLSFNYGNLNTAGTAGTAAESGMVNSGLAIGFSDYSNTIKIYYNKIELQSYSATVNAGGYKSVAITVTQDGKVTIVHGGITICSNYQLPAAYATDNKSSWQYALAARCGASNNYHSVKNVVIKDNDIQYSANGGQTWTSATTFTGLATGNYTIIARQSNGANCSNVTTVGTATITYTPDITATVAATSSTTCTTTGGTITISNVSKGLSSPYDLVNISLTNQQLGAATIGNLGTCCNPIWGGFGDLVLTPNTSNRAGYIAFNSTVATPNAFSANYDVFVGGGNGGDGLSFNYGNLNTAGTAGTAAEAGMVNSGLAIGFSDYSNTIKIYYNKIELQSYNQNLNANSYKSVAITVTYDGKLTLVYGGTTICSNYQLPAAYATDSKSNWQYALAARCGASNNYHSVKNVVIKDNSIQYTINGNTYTENPTFTNVSQGAYNVRARISNGAYCAAISALGSATIAPPTGMVVITGQPATANQSVAQNATATTLTVTATGEGPISYQWLSNTAASNNGGNPIVGATSASYTPPTSAAGTLYYYCAVSNACSEVNSAISGSVTTYIVPPNISYTTPVTYTVGAPIAPLTPTNTGGAVASAGIVVSTYAGIVDTSGNANGPVASATFNSTYTMFSDAAGNVYVADRTSSIRKISTDGMVTTFASGFNTIKDITIDAVGNLYVIDMNTASFMAVIRKITPVGVVTTLASNFQFASGIAVDSDGNVFVSVNNGIKKITPAGLVSTLALTDANGATVNLVNPSDLAIDSNGNLFLTLSNSNYIQKITPAGVLTTFAGQTSSGYTNGIGTAASFRYPSRMVIDAQNNIFVTETDNSLIRKITPSAVVSTYAGIIGTPGTINGPVASATFTTPNGIALDAAGNVFVGEQNTKIIRKIGAAGGYAISPSLPAGLSMDAATGRITGTPTVVSAATNYVVTTSNAGGSSSFTISITVSINFASTKIRASQCGSTLAAMNTQIAADVIFGAQMYRFEVTNGANVRTFETTKRNFDLTKMVGSKYATTYSIKVAVKVNNTWSDYGAACNITTPTLVSSLIVPLTNLRASQCGSTLAAIGSPIHSELVYGAEAYRFELTNGTTVTEVESPIYYFFLTDTAFGTFGTTFSVKTKAKIDGVWGNYGASCSISTPVLVANTVPLTQVSPSFCGTTLAAVNTKIPAVLVYNAEGYRFEITNGTTVTVYDAALYNFKLSDAGIVATSGTTYAIRVAAKINGVYGNYGASCNVTTPGNASNSRAVVENTTFSIVAYPNPSNSNFKLQFTGANEDAVSILVFDMTGRQIENKVVTANDIQNISLGQNYSTGVYNVSVSQGMNSRTVRLVKN